MFYVKGQFPISYFEQCGKNIMTHNIFTNTAYEHQKKIPSDIKVKIIMKKVRIHGENTTVFTKSLFSSHILNDILKIYVVLIKLLAC